MPRFITGDSLGNIKSLACSVSGKNTELILLSEGPKTSEEKPNAIHALAVDYDKLESTLVAAVYEDGSASTYSLEDNILTPLHHWKENRLKANQQYVGLSIATQGIFTCTSNGSLRMTPKSSTEGEARTGLLPTRLYSWKLAADQQTFAYGGDEVDLSLWNTEQAFQQPAMCSTADATSKKRKRKNGLFPGEIWRAKNLSNDSLSLRQPIRITSLSYLSTECPHHLLAGTQLGHLRRYDTRAARRPVADWTGIVKVGGIQTVEKGFSDHEAFVSDSENSMFSVDLRTGRVLYGYHGISGTVTSIAPSPTIVASASLDRYFRLHGTVPPPSEIGHNSEAKGQVWDKVYSKSIPTVIVWDGDTAAVSRADASAVNEDDAVWDAMENVDECNDDDDTELGDKRRRKVSRK